jgi:hypothetical protein
MYTWCVQTIGFQVDVEGAGDMLAGTCGSLRFGDASIKKTNMPVSEKKVEKPES